jgi:hypothetical protein
MHDVTRRQEGDVSDQDELDERLARIARRLSDLNLLTNEAREEIVAATEQLLDHAAATHRDSIEASSRARRERRRTDRTRR